MSILSNSGVAAAVAATFVLVLAGGCAPEQGGAPAEIGVENPAPSGSGFHSSPDSIDRTEAPRQGVDSAPCVFSPDAAERLGRTPCLT